MSARQFVKGYEAALATQDWSVVSPLMGADLRVVFSDGSVHRGKAAVQAAYERNFATIKGEDFKMENVSWLVESPDFAAYMFDFRWSGEIDGQAAAGSDRGTAVLAREVTGRVLVGEQLGPTA